MTDSEETHDQLVQAYLEYFRANEQFERRNSVRTHRYVRKCLRDIRSLAKERMEEVHNKYLTKKEAKKKGNP